MHSTIFGISREMAGVPVVTLTGNAHAGRVGVSQLSNLGLTELVCQTPAEHIATAVRLASNLEQLEVLRRELRLRLLSSPLMDAQRFTNNLERAYLVIWKNYIGASA